MSFNYRKAIIMWLGREDQSISEITLNYITELENQVINGKDKLAIATKLCDDLIESHEGTYGDDFWNSEMGKRAKEALAKIRGTDESI